MVSKILKQPDGVVSTVMALYQTAFLVFGSGTVPFDSFQNARRKRTVLNNTVHLFSSSLYTSSGLN
jgi:hypothetical protein